MDGMISNILKLMNSTLSQIFFASNVSTFVQQYVYGSIRRLLLLEINCVAFID